MNYNLLMDLAVDIGYELSMSGAETFRVEDSVSRILLSYGVSSEIFAIPNSLIVSILTETGKPVTRMRRLGFHGNDLDAVEKLNALSRRICAEKPSPEEAFTWLDQVKSSYCKYSTTITALGFFLSAFGFSALFHCGIRDMFISGLCAIIGGLVNRKLEQLKVNLFFTTIVSAFIMAFPAYTLNVAGIAQNVDGVVIGCLMLLVPGLLFTNTMRDIIYGDFNSGVNRLMQVILIALAIALGTASAWTAASTVFRAPVSIGAVDNSLLITCIGSALGCIGFSILFNIHGPGGILCTIGGVVTWAIYCAVFWKSGNELYGYFLASVFAAAYAETMARIRKYPAISYLVVALFPLIPGAGVYYTMNYAVHGQMAEFASQGGFTAAIAGVMATGILMVSTIVRLYYTTRENK